MAFSQESATPEKDNKPVLLMNYDRGFSSELNYQGMYGFAFGGILGKHLGHKIKPNYSCGLYADVVLADSVILGPRFKMTYNYLSVFGVGLNFSNHYRSGRNDFRITPEVNFSLFGIANLFVGYSFNVSQFEFNEFSEFRVGLSFHVIQR